MSTAVSLLTYDDLCLSPHDIVEPDLLFIRQDRLHIYKARGDVQGTPDLVVEIISPSSRKTDPGAKLNLYARLVSASIGWPTRTHGDSSSSSWMKDATPSGRRSVAASTLW